MPPHQVSPFRSSALRCVATLLVAACGVTEPVVFPARAVEMTPPAPYARWWALTESCSRHTAPFEGVRWFVVSGLIELDGEQYDGYWFSQGNRIVLASPSLYRGDVVRHEMLHSLLQNGEHPRPDFVDRCGGIVAVGDPLHIEPSALLPLPTASSPILSPADLQIGLEISPQAPTIGLPDSGWVTILVTVTNPSAEPVWVRVRPLFPGQSMAQTFGYSFGEREPLIAFDDYSADSLIPFGPHETKRRAFDENGWWYRSNDWRARGRFNGDSTPQVIIHPTR